MSETLEAHLLGALEMHLKSETDPGKASCGWWPGTWKGLQHLTEKVEDVTCDACIDHLLGELRHGRKICRSIS